MAATKEELKAAQVYRDICEMLDENGWNYKKVEEKLTIETGARGDDLPMDLTIKVDVKRQLIMLLSHLPYVISEDKRVETALAVSVVNNMLVDGCIDYDLSDGHIFFRMTNSYRDSDISKEVYKYLLYCACQSVDDFNDKLLMLSKGIIDLEKFTELYSKE